MHVLTQPRLAQGAPAPPMPPTPTPCAKRFDFRRLGLRTSAMLISPWIPKGTVIQEPKGPYNTSQFELTSVAATVKTLFNLSGFLTKRDAWAGSFDELLTLDAPREDAPLHLPEAPKPAVPFPPNQGWPPGVPPTALQSAETAIPTEEGPAGREPRHCSGNGKCAARDGVTQKQRNTIAQFVAVSGIAPPDLERMSHAEAATWISRAWHEHIEGTSNASKA